MDMCRDRRDPRGVIAAGRLLGAALVAMAAAVPAAPARGGSDSPHAVATAVDVLPTPKQVQRRDGRLALASRVGQRLPRCCVVAGTEAGYAAEVLAQRLAAPVVPRAQPDSVAVSLKVDAQASFAGNLGRDARPEAYRLEVGGQDVRLVAVEPEGLLRGAATLLQLLREEDGVCYLPCVTITDWPDFRRRCASHWLINVEINRWAYDWGDGPAAYLARVKRKLDLSFAYKINQVWFDGFGWDVHRFEGYADLMRQCNQYARRRGIKLTFAGYGGGYGTSYQASELYRCGYFGQTFLNRRPYPGGEEYFCRGIKPLGQSRRYGTCLSNEGLCRAKVDEMQRFAAAVEPGMMYIHDIDTGSYVESRESWLLRCPECRKRWPSDEVAGAQGQAGALAAWYRRVRSALDRVATPSGYRAARDLTLVFISPLYTEYYERGPADLWQREIDYFCDQGRLLGPAANIEIGLREQFYSPRGGKKIAELQAALDKAGASARLLVIAFGGGDHYLSDDLANVSGTMAHFYEGAESVCLCNGGVHEEPVQILNAEILWSGSAGGYREEPPDEQTAEAVFRRMAQGKHRPAEIFGPGRTFERICRRLWGDAAGKEMYLAYLTPGETGEGPVSRVWWSVTAEIARLRSKTPPGGPGLQEARARWVRRQATTERALVHARRAAQRTDHEDVRWFADCLALGTRFSECMALCLQFRMADDAGARARLAEKLAALESQIAAAGRLTKTDRLGGDPGCWLETVANLKKLNGL
jgi:hypothetical protein